MNIGIIGAGHIGKTLALELSKTGYDVKVANSRGPETVDPSVLVFGARAVTIEQAVEDVDVLVLSIPLNRVPEVAPKLAALPKDVIVIDTSNYYPLRDTEIADIEAGEAESVWVSKRLGRPVAKAWNAIGSDSFARLGKPAGDPDRIAIPVAADDERDRRVAMALVGDTGFDAVDAGSLAISWRQQPGARPAVARTSRPTRCPVPWPPRNDPACRSGGTCPSPRFRRGLAIRRAIPTRTFSYV